MGPMPDTCDALSIDDRDEQHGGWLYLVEEPLPDLGALVEVFARELAALVVSLGEVEQDRAGLPDDLVVVGVVDDGGDAAVAGAGVRSEGDTGREGAGRTG